MCMKTSSVFSIALLCAGIPVQVVAADVAYYGIAKGQQFSQAPAAAVVLLASNAFTFQSFVIGSSTGAVLNATVKPSNTTPLRQLTNDAGSVLWRFEDYADTQSQLDSTYPTGTGFSPATYTITMEGTNDGVRTATLNFWLLPPLLPINYPPTPEITNLLAAQAIDHTDDFTLHWNSLGGGSLTIVQLVVLDASSNLVFATPAPFESGALTGASNSTVIPAYALPPGQSLIGHLTAANPGLPNTNSYAGATGIATLAKDTQFPLATRPAPPAPILELLSADAAEVRLRATQQETNRVYRLAGSTNFQTWLDVAATNPAGAVVEFADPSPAAAQKFYRLRIGP
jgi:hypothetical protein